MDAASIPPSVDVSSAAAPASRGVRRLWLYGAGMIGILASLALRYPLPGNDDDLQDIGQMSEYGVTEFIWYVVATAALFALYVLALQETRRLSPRRALPPVFACGAGLAAVTTAMYPVTAIDNFIYFVSARLLTVYHVNPMTSYPQDFADNDPFMRFAGSWQDDLSPYGPLWNLIAVPISLLAGDRPGVAVFGFKVLGALCLLAGGWVISRTLWRARPADAAWGALFYLWNPLVLWEAVGNGHNDAVLMLPVLLAFYAWTKGRDALVIPLLLVAGLIKFATLPVIPLAAVALWRRDGDWSRRRDLVLNSTMLSGLALLVGFFPFYDLEAVRRILMIQDTMILHSPTQLTISLLQERYGFEEVRGRTRDIAQAALVATLAVQGVMVWRRPRLLPRAAFDFMCVVLLVASWVRPWYGIWIMALAGLLPPGWPARRAIAWSVGGLSLYALMIWIWHWWPTDIETIHNFATVVMFGPFLIAILAEAISATRRQRLRRSLKRGRAGMAGASTPAINDPSPAAPVVDQYAQVRRPGAERR